MRRIRIYILFFTLISFGLNSFAQKQLEIFNDGVVVKSVLTSDVDSINVTNSSPRKVQFWKGGKVSFSYNSSYIQKIVVKDASNVSPLSYAGVIGFNDELYIKNIDVLSNSTSSDYKSFIDNNLPMKNGSVLYFAVDKALDMLKHFYANTPINNVNLVTFTDGLDQGSTMINNKYSTSNSYLTALNNIIRNTQVLGLPLNAYTIGFHGTDVSDDTMFDNNLSQLASGTSNVYKVNSFSDLKSKLNEIADLIINMDTYKNVCLNIAGPDDQTKVRFVFDGKSATQSSVYIEGIFDWKTKSLLDVTYHGMNAKSGRIVPGTQNGIFVMYNFIGLQGVSTNDIKYYYRFPSSSTWQMSSETTLTSSFRERHSGSVTMLVLDCSSSIGSNYDNMIDNAKSFVNKIADNALEPTEPDESIIFKDSFVRDLCVKKWDKNRDGKLSYKEAASVMDLGDTFENNNSIKTFDELKYFTGLNKIGESTFSNCNNLTSVTLPENIIEVGGFKGCSKLHTVVIPDGVETIASDAFLGCSGLTLISIPMSVNSIGSCAFANCSRLSSISIPEGVSSIAQGTFEGCSSLTTVYIPENVKSIGTWAFYDCIGLQNLVIPKGIKDLGKEVFEGCTNLTLTLDCPSIVSSKYVADTLNENLLVNFIGAQVKSVIIGDNVKSIGDGAFYNFKNLESITISNSVITIGDNTFGECTSLSSIIIPNNVTSIGDCIFKNCTNLKSVTLSNKIYAISDGAFQNCTSLSSINIPGSVNSIGTAAFYKTGLTKIELPSGIKSIGYDAFRDSWLKEVKANMKTPCVITDKRAFDDIDLCTLYVPYGTSNAYWDAGWTKSIFYKIIEM